MQSIPQCTVNEGGELVYGSSPDPVNDDNIHCSLVLTPLSSSTSIRHFLDHEVNKVKENVAELYYDARCCALIADSFPLLTHMLTPKTFPHLQALYLRNITFTTPHLDLLCALFHPSKHRAQIHTLQVYRCLWTNEQFIRFLQSSKGNIALQQLDFTFNAIGDRGFQTFAEILAYHETCIRKVSIGNNQLTDDSIAAFIQTYFQHFQFHKPSKEQLQILHIQNHRKITSLHLDSLFENIVYTNQLQELNLAACAIENCDWARYLPFVRSLQRLNLSHNYINNRNLIKLAIGLERCHALIELNLSYNRFYSYHCHYLRNILEKNQSLQVLYLNGNHFQDPSVYASIAMGLKKNQALLTFAMEECGMKIENIRELVSALQVNTHVELIIRSNPLPPQIIENPRKYFLKELNLKYLSRTREVDSLNHATMWRKRQLEKIQLALESLAIVKHDEPDRDHHPAGEEQPSAVLQHTVDSPVIKDNIVSVHALNSKELFHRAIWKQEVVERCEYYNSVQVMEKMVDDIEVVHSAEGKYIEIAFGRESFPIGKLEIFSHTTYDQLRELIKPLLEVYLRTVDQHDLDHYRNFKVIDPKGKGVDTEEDLKVRIMIIYCNLKHNF